MILLEAIAGDDLIVRHHLRSLDCREPSRALGEIAGKPPGEQF